MYIHWTHQYLPRVFGFLSYICNPLFIYLIITDPHSSKLGKYRYLLLFFACFDMSYSAVDIFVPMAIHGTGAAFVVCIAHGPFYDSDYGENALTLRTSFVALSYGILVIHFIYRYLVLYRPSAINMILNPIGMVFVFLFFAMHSAFWFTVCKICLRGVPEVRNYIHDDFMETYNVDAWKLAILTAVYYDVSPDIVFKSWIGILLLTCLSCYAISTYFILGYKILKKLKEHRLLSNRTSILHKLLFKALVVQTAIPICISFAPCLIAWYTPSIGLNVEIWNNYFAVTILATFPTLDPLAVIFFIAEL